ncbi:multifunctional CCA addition/repair protein [Variovorax sp. NFACC27]|uniref:multifunctional CCA addition/repair protein n=1 Tax=unclassified Variovorax TaxID=663243 RepID=UPI00089D09EC|nr:multifunctional CCA addition/repair protein [Variovorax sp. YR750]MDP9602826.1 tRNA nucleotidyltransferase (CCA-adding enzyme) [Variovorax paradoxus]SEF20631.1 tRNA nucleotidyltransferase (CCA-adding enzyme) [Variovorax sp. NFACC28]SEF56060.1 tRNA nucleotidyltransferase (CCA-adding enzyme) [Variovorax sp. NFACC29]SFB70427.1 tRNA nucleotidyltransferase (CCA-adding enzyme) [Variovorax sp. NFACC26]SFG52415.1 tRNA nucleotidyltransferase (CCA-adding enzyme) [Variovorax sp. NFACC27]
MKIFLVGGALRDRLLDRPVSDHDWLVVGATPEEMVARGYLPVGRDFPVFLHPETREEYALARTERKSAPGYRGFTVHAAPDVTLEQDLARRDLTVNAIALPSELVSADGRFDPTPGTLADPFHGQRDLRDKVLRHVTDAFREDPVRILRVARFAARFDDFGVAPETKALMREMVAAGEVDALVPERVWQELSRGLMETRPSRMFEVLRECGALAVLLPEIEADARTMQAIDIAAGQKASLAVRFACLTGGLGRSGPPGLKALHAVCERWRVPVEIRELAEVVAREQGHIDDSGTLDASGLVRLLERCDAFRKPARFAEALQACECDARSSGGGEAPYAPRQHLLAVLATAAAVPTDVVARAAQQSGATGPKIGEAIHRARVEAVAASPA